MMEWSGKCPQCDINLVYCHADSTITWTCPKCGWSLATTYMSPINQDINKYEVQLIQNLTPSINQLKILSQISGKNFLRVKKMLESDDSLLFKGKAVDVSLIKTQLEQEKIGFKIIPHFDY